MPCGPREPGRRTYLLWLAIALVLDLCAAVFWSGHHHPDEFYQTIEFANLKLGGTTPERLTWEYEARIRPWLLPDVYLTWAWLGRAVGIRDPFDLALGFRLGSAALAWCGLALFGLAILTWVEDAFERHLAFASVVLPAWIPFVAARTSSENLCSASVLAGTGLLVLATSETVGSPARADVRSLRFALGAGAAFGLAFQFRYQAALFLSKSTSSSPGPRGWSSKRSTIGTSNPCRVSRQEVRDHNRPTVVGWSIAFAVMVAAALASLVLWRRRRVLAPASSSGCAARPPVDGGAPACRSWDAGTRRAARHGRRPFRKANPSGKRTRIKAKGPKKA